MKRQLIELEKLDELLIDYNSMGNKGESFSDFIRVSKCLFNEDEKNEYAIFDWVYIDEKDIMEVREDE